MGARTTVVAMLAVTALLASGCGENSTEVGTEVDEAGSSVDLTGSSWVLESFTADGDAVPASPRAEATLTLGADSQAHGSTGCNRFGASWQQQGDALTIELGPMTQAACRTQDLADQEQALLTLLPMTAQADQSDDLLTLRDEDGQPLLVYAAGLTDLAGTSWSATGINNQSGGVESTAQTSTVTAVFSDDGSMSGSTGCRDYTAAWTTENGTIEIRDVEPEGDPCAGGELDTLERNYLAALQNAATFSIEGSTLNLRDKDGATQVNFSRTDS